MCKRTSKLETSSYWFHIDCTNSTVSVANREDCKCWSLESPCPIKVPFSRRWICRQFPEVLCLHCPDAAPFLSLGALPCSALSWGWGLQGATHPLSPRVPNPLCTCSSPCSTTSHPAWGSVLHLRCLAAKNPFQTKHCPFSPLPENTSYPQCVHTHATLKQSVSEHC